MADSRGYLPDQLLRDSAVLRTVAADVKALTEQMQGARTRMMARERGYFMQHDDDEVRRIFLGYRNHRIAVLELIAGYRDFADFEDDNTQHCAFLLAFGAAIMLYNWSSLLVDTICREDITHWISRQLEDIAALL